MIPSVRDEEVAICIHRDAGGIIEQSLNGWPAIPEEAHFSHARCGGDDACLSIDAAHAVIGIIADEYIPN